MKRWRMFRERLKENDMHALEIPEQSLNRLRRSDDFAKGLMMMCLEIADELKSALLLDSKEAST